MTKLVLQATFHLSFIALMSIVPLLNPHCVTYLRTRLILGNLAAWTQSACIVYPSPVFDPPAIVDTIQAERCTALHGVPTHFIGVLTEVEKRRRAAGLTRGKLEGFERLRTGIAAGAPVPIDLMKRLINEMGLTELTNAYGMSE